MTAFASNISAQRVRLSVCKLERLAAHPACIAGCLESINNDDENIELFVESDPAIALAIINLCRQEKITFDFANLNFVSLLRQIPKSQLVKTILGIDIHEQGNEQKLDFVMNLNLRSGLCAYTARLIAEKSSPSLASQAFIAGLFADIGLLALTQLFSKSITMLFEEAKGQRNALAELENRHLGITDNVLSNQLLTKLQFPAAVAEAVWLAPKASSDLIGKLPNGKLIGIVRLAEILSSPTIAGDISYISKHLFLTDSDISQIRQKTADHHTRIGKLFGYENKDYRRTYLEAIKNIYLKQLSAETSEDNFSQFVQKFLDSFLPSSPLSDATEIAAKIFAESFLTHKLCVFTADTANADLILSFVINGMSAKSVLLNSPDGFSMANAEREDLAGWLFEQIGIESEKSYYIPIKNAGRTVAGIILDGPMPDKKLLDKITSLLGVIFALTGENDHQKQITQIALDTAGVSEPVQQIAKPESIVSEQPVAPAAAVEKQDITQLAAELAAGAAHELNNPLAVISGRAQMLIAGEADETRQQILSQIVEKTKDIEEIIGQLMCYALPPVAKIRTVSPFIVINNCLERVNARYLSEPVDIHLENIENLSDIEVDAEQLAESLAQIIYNALESYESGNGPVQITGAENDESIEITIRDYGCGMSEETLGKATEPFFSDKPAGRQRGMGLSIAAGLLKNNSCTSKMESQPDAGTTIRINLPKAS